ncbi:MAG: RIO1 family regulatory kinase/ATPase domain-containing protein [Wenzhouxiangella sp.]
MDALPDPDTIRQLDWSSGQSLGQSNQGEARRFRLDSGDLVIKTPRGRGPLRQLHARSLRREYRAYQRLAGLAGFPRCLGLIDGQRLAMDYVEGEAFRDARLADRDAFFARLLTIIQAMHAAGVAHGDLKRKANLLVTRDQSPVIIDLGTAVLRPASGRGPGQWLFHFMRQTDLNAWVKLKYGGYQNVSTEDRQHLKRSRLERLLSQLRRR